MCGRYLLTTPGAELAAEFGLAAVPADLAPRYNIAPSQPVAVVGAKPGGTGRGLVFMKWGFVPRTAAGPTAGPRPTNARAETAGTSPLFGPSLRRRRCLVPADGFYEWRPTPAGKRAVWYRPPAGRPVAFAGVWDVWRDPADPAADAVYTCAILTVAAGGVVAGVHDRMPLVVGPADYARWLAADTPPAEVRRLLVPRVIGYDAVPVGPAVNSARTDGPECLTAA